MSLLHSRRDTASVNEHEGLLAVLSLARTSLFRECSGSSKFLTTSQMKQVESASPLSTLPPTLAT